MTENSGMRRTIPGDFDGVKSRATEALGEQGFGILSEIDVQQVLKAKLGKEIERYEILGVCNPQLAFAALSVDRSLGLLLPCTMVLRELGGEVEVSIADPEAVFTLAPDASKADLAGVPAEAKQRLWAALNALAGA